MIVVKSPLRITIAGGGTDLPWWYKKNNGLVISAAIDKFINITGFKRYYDKNQPILMKKSVARRAIKRKTDAHTKIRDNLALRMRLALREQNLTKRNTTNQLVGCSIKFLKKYLEEMFYPNPETNEMMSWKNYSIKGWHIDHIRACSKFDLSDEKQQKECFNYKNLQPLWAKENILKSNN